MRARMENADGTQCVATPVPADPIPGLYKAAHDARSTAEAATEAAAQAVKDAMKYGAMYSTVAVHGDSDTAVENAQKVFDAKANADMAVTDAEAAKMAAETAKTAAGDLAADDPNRAAVMAAIDAAVKAADEAIKAAKASQDVMGLKDAYKAVIVDAKKPKTAAHWGEQAAMAIGGALGPHPDGNGGGTRHEHMAGDTAPTIPPTSMKSAVMMDDSTGMTWAQIVGEDNVMMSRLADDNTEVMIASIAGMTATEVHASRFTGTFTNGQGILGAMYKDIPGIAHCLGTDCMVGTVGADDGKLTGSWYFQPTSPKAYYEKVGAATDYSEEMNYARFGHWLVVDAGEVTVHTYAWSNGNIQGVDLEENPELDGSATYSGTATGMSLHKEFDSQGERTSIASGRFTADVALTADFDNDPTVKGTIDNFQGPATDSSWKVELKDMTLGTTLGNAGETATGGMGDDGQWNHEAYGVADKRPTGIFGDFTAHWTDGHAAGAYATRRD